MIQSPLFWEKALQTTHGATELTNRVLCFSNRSGSENPHAHLPLYHLFHKCTISEKSFQSFTKTLFVFFNNPLAVLCLSSSCPPEYNEGNWSFVCGPNRGEK